MADGATDMVVLTVPVMLNVLLAVMTSDSVVVSEPLSSDKVPVVVSEPVFGTLFTEDDGVSDAVGDAVSVHVRDADRTSDSDSDILRIRVAWEGEIVSVSVVSEEPVWLGVYCVLVATAATSATNNNSHTSKHNAIQETDCVWLIVIARC